MKAPFEAIGRGVKTSNSSLLPASLIKGGGAKSLKGSFGLKAACLQQPLSVGCRKAGKVGEDKHQVARITTTQHLSAEGIANSSRQCTMFLKIVGYIHCQDLAPQITIIASSITAAPNVVEIRRGITGRNLCVE